MSEKYAGATPGPWVLDQTHPHSLLTKAADILGPDGFRICTLPRQARRPWHEIAANGCLIVDAPTLAADNAALREVVGELVEAVKDAHAALEAQIRVEQNPHSDRMAQKASDKTWKARASEKAALTRAQPFLEGNDDG